MKLWEKLSGIIFRQFAARYLQTFHDNSPEKVLKRSLNVLDTHAIEGLRKYVINHRTQSGGFADKAGRADIYYTLFGFFLADALEMEEIIPSMSRYVESRTSENNLTGIHLYCAVILSARLGITGPAVKSWRRKVSVRLSSQLGDQPAYGAFLNLLTCYYAEDYKNIYLIKKHLNTLSRHTDLPCPVVAALLVMERSFNKPVNKLKNDLLSFYGGNGGFKATRGAPSPDLLSTAVALYALRFADADLRTIKPDCLDFVDSLYREGGFGGNVIDTDPDIEYTFYGLLALGALTE